MTWMRSPGLQLVAIGVLHNLVGLVLAAGPLRAIVADGFFDAVGHETDRMAAFWFVWFGWMLMLLGGAMRALEPRPVPLGLVVGCAAMILGGCAAMPVSGFWFGLLPVAGMVAGRVRPT